MKRIFTAPVLIALFFSCKNSTNSSKQVTAADFIKMYKPLDLPVNISDSGLIHFGDTTTISEEVFYQFISDSAIRSLNVSEYKIYAAGIIHFKTIDYLVTKFTLAKTIKLAVFVLDEKHQYKNFLLLLSSRNKNDEYRNSLSITNEPAFIIRKEKTGKDNEVLYSKTGYAFSESTNAFAEVMNDSNEDTAISNNIINPIDTLARLNKFSGDYITDNRNFISVRDGKNLQTYKFFIHFEKNKDACTGELKGEMTLTNETNAVYQESGDPCVIRFKFTAANIKVKEEGNCGNYRGITCPFDFTFKRKKQIKTTTN